MPSGTAAGAPPKERGVRRRSGAPFPARALCCRITVVLRGVRLYYNTRMRKRKQDIRQVVETPLLGYSVLVLALTCFLLLLAALIILTRVVVS